MEKIITVSAIRQDYSNLTDTLPIYEIEGIHDDKMINQLLVGADGCKYETEVCKISSGVSVDRSYPFLPLGTHISDNDKFTVSIDVMQAKRLLSTLDWEINGDLHYTSMQWDKKQYLLILSTFDNVMTPVVKMKLVNISHEPVSLERGMTLDYPIHINTWATYGAPAQIDLFAIQDAKDSGIKVWIEPEMLVITERNNATSTLFIHASDSAKDGLYDIRVIGKANGNNAGLHCSHTECPTINIWNSDWSIDTFGSDQNMGIGGGKSPENTLMEIELNKKEFFENDIVEVKAYIVNNSDEKLEFIPRELLIKVIKAQDVGYYDNLYGINAMYESDTRIILDPNSRTLLVRPFYWDQTTFQNFDDVQRLDLRQYKMIATFVGENHTWKSNVEFEIK